MQRVLLVAVLCLSLIPSGSVAAGQIVQYQRTDDGGDNSLVDLFKKTYNEPQVETGSALTINRWNAYKSLQNAMAEMMVDPAESAKMRQDFQDKRNISDGYNMEPAGWGYKYMYWNRGDAVEAKVPLADGSGKVARTTTFGKEIGMDGKNLYMPDAGVLDKIMELQNAQQDLAQKYGIGIQKPPQDVIDKYNVEAQKLEQEFLKTVAAEIPKLKAAAKGQKVYALGFKYDDQDNISPLELNVSMIESALRRLGVPIPDASQPATTAQNPAQPAPVITEPAIKVRQSKQILQETNREYDALTMPFPDETSRTKAELENDMFRVRTRPADIQPGVKTYDLLLSPEYSAGALSLPSKQPADH